MISPLSRLSLLAALGLALPPLGGQTFTAKDRQPTPEELTHLPAVTASKVDGLMKDVSAPSEFQVTIFATPPAVNYPVFVAAATETQCWRSCAMWSAIKLPAQPRGLISPDLLERLLNSANPVVRRTAANSASRLVGPAATPALVSHLADPDPIVAHAVVRALSDRSAVDACLKVIDLATAQPEVRSAALRVLQSLHQPGVADPLIQRLSSEKSESHRGGCIPHLRCRFFEQDPFLFKGGILACSLWVR